MNTTELRDRLSKLTPDEQARFTKLFLPVFLSNGYGAMTKRDTEALIYLILRKIIPESAKSDIYAWAKTLKTTPSRINSLQLESHLRFAHLFSADIANDNLAHLKSAIVEVQISVDSGGKQLTQGNVRLQIESPVGRFEIEQALKEMHIAVDYERNRKNLRIGFVDFLRLVNKLTDENEEDIINRIAEGKAEENSKLAGMMKEIENASYAQLSEGGKLKAFVALCGETFAEKPKKLIEHLGLIFGSQKHQKK